MEYCDRRVSRVQECCQRNRISQIKNYCWRPTASLPRGIQGEFSRIWRLAGPAGRANRKSRLRSANLSACTAGTSRCEFRRPMARALCSKRSSLNSRSPHKHPGGHAGPLGCAPRPPRSDLSRSPICFLTLDRRGQLPARWLLRFRIPASLPAPQCL